MSEVIDFPYTSKSEDQPSIHGELQLSRDYSTMPYEVLETKQAHWLDRLSAPEASPRAKDEIIRALGRIGFELNYRDEMIEKFVVPNTLEGEQYGGEA